MGGAPSVIGSGKLSDRMPNGDRWPFPTKEAAREAGKTDDEIDTFLKAHHATLSDLDQELLMGCHNEQRIKVYMEERKHPKTGEFLFTAEDQETGPARLMMLHNAFPKGIKDKDWNLRILMSIIKTLGTEVVIEPLVEEDCMPEGYPEPHCMDEEVTLYAFDQEELREAIGMNIKDYEDDPRVKSNVEMFIFALGMLKSLKRGSTSKIYTQFHGPGQKGWRRGDIQYSDKAIPLPIAEAPAAALMPPGVLKAAGLLTEAPTEAPVPPPTTPPSPK